MRREAVISRETWASETRDRRRGILSGRPESKGTVLRYRGRCNVGPGQRGRHRACHPHGKARLYIWQPQEFMAESVERSRLAMTEGFHEIWVDLEGGIGGGSKVRMRSRMAYRGFRRLLEGRSGGRGSRMASQGFRRRKDDGRRTIAGTSRVELKAAIVIVLDAATPV